MRVLVIDASEGFNGSGVLAARWAGHLRRRGIDAVASLPNDPDGPLGCIYAAAGVPVLGDRISLEADGVVLFTTASARALVERVGRLARSIWLIRDGQAGIAALAAAPGIDRLWQGIGALVFHDPIQPREMFAPFLHAVPSDRVHIVPPGVDPPEAAVAPPSADRSLRVAVSGTIGPRKRQGDLLLALAALAEPGMTAELIGRVGELPAAAVRAAQAMPERLRFHGELPPEAALDVLSGCHAVALPSGDEVAPLVVLEAAVRGLVPVLADLPAYRSLWRHGRNCLLHPPGDVEMLAWCLRILAFDPRLRQRLAAAARETAARLRTELFCTRMDIVMASLG